MPQRLRLSLASQVCDSTAACSHGESYIGLPLRRWCRMMFSQNCRAKAVTQLAMPPREMTLFPRRKCMSKQAYEITPQYSNMGGTAAHVVRRHDTSLVMNSMLWIRVPAVQF